jgi:hypothetical protein
MAEPLPTVTIDRAKWGHGLLYDPDSGRYCALGFTLQALGVSDDLMAGHCFPTGFREQLSEVVRNLLYDRMLYGETCLHNWAFAVAGANDFRDLAPAAREAAIAEALGEAGFSVAFVN